MMASWIEHIKEKKKYYLVGTGATLALSTLVWLGVRNNSVQVLVDGEVIGIMKTLEEAQTSLTESVANIEEALGKTIVVQEEVTFVPVNSSKDEQLTQEALQDVFEAHITYEVSAVEVIVDGEVRAVIDSKDLGEEVLQEIALRQLPEGSTVELVEGQLSQLKKVEQQKEEKQIPEASGAGVAETEGGTGQTVNETSTAETVLPEQVTSVQGETHTTAEDDKLVVQIAEVDRKVVMTAEGEPVDKVNREYKDFQFYETVELKSTYTDEEAIMSKEETLDVLLSNTDEVVKYVLEEGDNVWDIALEYETTMDRLLEINPQITDVNRMQIGEEIKVIAPDPIVSIATTEVAVFNEIIPAEIEYVEDDTVYKGEEVIKQEGRDGIKELTVSVDKVNNKEVNRTHLAEKVLQEPVTKIIAYGTKEKPKNSGGVSVSPAKPGMFMNPLNGAGYVSSYYGSRWGSFHRGIDIAAPAGTPIYAAASGTVIYSAYNNGGFGNLVMIDHGNGYQTYYAHNSKNFVKVGQKVSKGQNIASVGSTGNSTGNHIHFEIRLNGTPINPYSYIY